MYRLLVGSSGTQSHHLSERVVAVSYFLSWCLHSTMYCMTWIHEQSFTLLCSLPPPPIGLTTLSYHVTLIVSLLLLCVHVFVYIPSAIVLAEELTHHH